MNSIKINFNKVITSKNIKEMFINIPWSFVYFLLFIPLFLIMSLPLFQLIEDILFPINQVNAFSCNVQTINRIAVSLGVISVLLITAKLKAENKPRHQIFSTHSPLIFFGILVLCMIISTIINGFTEAALYGDAYRCESLLTFILYFVFYFTVSASLNTVRAKRILIYAYIISSIPIGIFMMADKWIAPVAAFNMGSGPSAIFHQFNHYGYFLLMNILTSEVLFIKEKQPVPKIICMISFIINNIVLVINDTFGCYLACFAAIVFSVICLLVCEKKLNTKAIIMLGIFIGISLIMSIWYDTVLTNISTFIQDLGKVSSDTDDADTAGTGRWPLWKHTVSYIKERPLFGFGVEGIAERLFAEEDTDNNRPHCEFLQYAAFFGIPAAIAYISGVFTVFLNGLKKKYTLDIYTTAAIVSAFGYLVSSLFGNTMYYTAPNFFILLGLAFNTREKNEEITAN